ncbi:oligosaccharide flippase family protein [Bacteroides caecigallinarum]|uniref:oligosaccharide flippase family protein n=1 Tax=Bacteroides caecigallinarum TaxID=1411144 RepID=UPI0019567998|nr:oligosaccharide flippase family protein [Bacteroides caecigallinarum]MBM6866730.1 oligosaccharide flippase family protein [Bacteroides caecigallinarum]
MSLKKNFLYSSILTTANYIFPLITYPYVSRILGVTNIGLYNFADSIINYFIMFSMMGIGIIGIREIAATQDDKNEKNKVFSSLFILNAVLTLLALAILIICIFTVHDLRENKELMYVGVLKLISNLFLIDWFYKGLEKFKYITNVTLTIKMLYVVSVFIFVKESNDYTIYYLLCTLMITLNAIANFIYAFKYVKFDFKSLNIRKYVKTNFVLGVYCFLTSMYTSFNVAYLGFVSNTTEVGYYATGTKLFSIIIALYSAFTGVVQPRMSSLLSENKFDEFIGLIKKSTDLLLTITVPAVLFTCAFSPEIIKIISGEGYEGAIIPTRIVMPLIFIIGYEQILVIQILTPLKKDKQILINSISGAIVGLILNIILVNKYASIGSAIVWVMSELTVLISAQYFVMKYAKVSFPYMKLAKEIMRYIPLLLLYWGISQYIDSNLIINFGIGTIITGIYVFVVKRKFITEIIKLRK